MTSTEIAQREEPTSGAELVRNEQTDGWIPVLQPIVGLANEIAETEFVPAALRGNSPAVAACILFGREIDVAPMHALQNIHIIEGRPSVSAEQMRAMVLAAGHEIAFGETSGAMCEIKGRRKGSQTWTVVQWTAAMADAAQLLGKKNWIRYRGDMLIARASAKLCRMIFADVVRGMRTTEELEDDADGSSAPVGSRPPASSGTKVSRRGAKAQGAAIDAGPAAAVPGPAPSTQPVDIAPPPPPAAPSDPAAKPDTSRCPHISNGIQCTYPVHKGEHSYELPEGMVDAEIGDRAAYLGMSPQTEPSEYSGSAGDGSPDDVAATGDDGEYQRMLDEQAEAERHAESMLARAQAAADAAQEDSGPVDTAPKPMHTAQTKALQARFKGLGFTDEPEDREIRLLIAGTIAGHTVDTFRTGVTADHLTYDEAQSVLSTLAPCRSRDDVIALMVKMAQDGAAEEVQGD
jgi:hypothetical protein